MLKWIILDCAKRGYPGVYAKVSTAIDWLIEKVEIEPTTTPQEYTSTSQG